MGAALVRELAEELDIEVQMPDSSPWASLSFDGNELNVFLVDDWLGEPRIAAIEEHDALGWFDREALNRLVLAHPDYVLLLGSALA